KNVEGLAGHYDADNKSNRDRDAEVDWDAGVLQVVNDTVPLELFAGSRPQTCCVFDPLGQFRSFNARLRLYQNEGELCALLADKIHCLAVASMHDGIARERRGGV